MKNRKMYFVPLSIFLLGIIFGSFFDLQINTALYLPGNFFGLGFSAFVPWLSYGLLVLFCGFFHRFAIKEKNTLLKIGLFGIAAVGFIASTYFSASKVTSINAFDCEDMLWLWLIVCAVLFSGVFYVGDFIGKKNEDRKLVFALLIFVMFVMIDLVPIAQVLKSFMRRPRYRVIAEGLFENKIIFMNWWQPYKAYGSMLEKFGPTASSFSEQFKSFPSGHTSEAAMLIFGLPCLSLIIPQLKGKENILFFAGIGYSIAMAFSRITMGAHYLTDVSFGGLFMVICCIFANEIILNYFVNEKEEVKHSIE